MGHPVFSSGCNNNNNNNVPTKLCSPSVGSAGPPDPGPRTRTVASPSRCCPVLPKQVPITAGLPARGPGRARQNESGESERLELIRTIWTRYGPEFVPARRNVSHSWRGRRRLIKQGSGNNELRGAAGGDGERERERARGGRQPL